jgi:hypothetical protein
MYTFQSGGSVERLLEELHAKKRWLDQMIAGLEAAADSPQLRLIAQAAETFEEAGAATPKVDLIQSKRSELQRLAQHVGGRRSLPRGTPPKPFAKRNKA